MLKMSGAALELRAAAPDGGVPIAVIMQIPAIGSRDSLDHLLLRMVRDSEITRVGRGRYPRETVIAEKFQAMVTLGLANTRMKDFYATSMIAPSTATSNDCARS